MSIIDTVPLNFHLALPTVSLSAQPVDHATWPSSRATRVSCPRPVSALVGAQRCGRDVIVNGPAVIVLLLLVGQAAGVQATAHHLK